MNIYYVTLCIPVLAESEEAAFAIGHDMVSDHIAMFKPDDIFGGVIGIEEEPILDRRKLEGR